jgi:pantoate--beta-alanine ligase
MLIIRTIKEQQQYSTNARKAGKRIGLVPTMGFLHEGHLSLVDEARKRVDVVILTNFVNPTQFGPNEDLDCYPRDFGRDCQLCEARGVDVVFSPEADEMYVADSSTWVIEEKLSSVLCGASRAGHFRGVTTIVTKLFNATLPDVAIFGQKDAQQTMVLSRMTRDLNFPIEIVVAPLVREPDGLAMSSRNRYLSDDERARALSISKSLFAARDNYDANAIARIIENISAAGGNIDYVEELDAETLEAPTLESRQILIAAAVFFGKTRLIDNIIIER